jgi:hypothetical protein
MAAGDALSSAAPGRVCEFVVCVAETGSRKSRGRKKFSDSRTAFILTAS